MRPLLGILVQCPFTVDVYSISSRALPGIVRWSGPSGTHSFVMFVVSSRSRFLSSFRFLAREFLRRVGFLFPFSSCVCDRFDWQSGVLMFVVSSVLSLTDSKVLAGPLHRLLGM